VSKLVLSSTAHVIVAHWQAEVSSSFGKHAELMFFHLQVLNEVSDVVSLKYMPIAPDPLEVKLKGL
jgi:hypothetical protein